MSVPENPLRSGADRAHAAGVRISPRGAQGLTTTEITIPTDCPSPAMLLALREALGLSVADLAHHLGFQPHNGERIVRAWEIGERGGEPFRPTQLAWTAFRLLCCMVDLYDALEPGEAKDKVRDALPEGLR